MAIWSPSVAGSDEDPIRLVECPSRPFAIAGCSVNSDDDGNETGLSIADPNSVDFFLSRSALDRCRFRCRLLEEDDMIPNPMLKDSSCCNY